MPLLFKKNLHAACVLFAIAASVTLRAQDEPLPPVPDVLVYKDGDRVQGRLIAREGDFLVFRTVRFGELRVNVADAQVMTAGKLTVVEVAAAKKVVEADGTKKVTGVDTSKATKAVVPVKAETPPAVSSTPDELTHWFRRVFGSWHGRFALSSQIVSDTTDRSDFMAEAKLKRNWKLDELSATARYDYSKTNDELTTDVIKGNGLWRHTLPHRLFTVYRPSYEWNRSFEDDNGMNTSYVLLQQEVGLGVTVVDGDQWKVRVGVAENFFDAWDTTRGGHISAHVESLFAEADLKLRWRITVTERAVFYYAIETGNTGWENQFEVTKKLTDTFSLGIRQEVRYNDPDVRSQDYSLTRFFLGFDF